jgi:thiamine biosynthesis lipoprotein
MNEVTFDAMGCEIVLGGDAVSARDEIARLFGDRELIFSRFIPDSELNRVNASAGRPTLVSSSFAETLRVALDAEEETGGLVSPMLGAALVAAGYTRDSASLTPDPRPVGPVDGARPIAVLGRIVGLPPGVQLDLNGVVKSLAVDDAMTRFRGDGFVSAGGDVATRGPLSVALPGGGAVGLVHGALATSGASKRRWLRGGEVQHHLLDPRTGRPSTSPWASVTACGASCVAADVAAKAGFLAGEAGPSWLDGRGIPARFTRADGTIVTNERWDASMREAVACT